MSEDIAVAIISTFVPAIAALMSGLLAWLIKRLNSRRKEIETALEAAISDIRFLLEVEKIYGEEMKFHLGRSMRNSIRKRVRLERGYDWSGRYIPSRTKMTFNKSAYDCK